MVKITVTDMTIRSHRHRHSYGYAQDYSYSYSNGYDMIPGMVAVRVVATVTATVVVTVIGMAEFTVGTGTVVARLVFDVASAPLRPGLGRSHASTTVTGIAPLRLRAWLHYGYRHGSTRQGPGYWPCPRPHRRRSDCVGCRTP